MKILVVCQYYSPEPFRIADICEWLVKNGHEVQVVTGLPNYPMGEIYEGFRHGERRDEVTNGVKVHRCFTIGRRRGALYRLLNYYSFAFSSTAYVSKMKENFDVVFVNQLSPVMMAEAALKYQKKHGKKVLLYCLDLWPESLAVGGIQRGSLLYRLFHRVSRRIYQRVDRILITSRSFSGYFEEEFGIQDTVYLPQYSETLFTAETCKKAPNETVDLMFAGNIGAAQSVDTILLAAKEAQDIPNLRWHIVGDGSEFEKMKKMASEMGLQSVVFHGRQPLEKMPAYYAMADAMLITMKKDSVISLTLPGKVQTYMAAGKPIIGAIDGETATVIGESGCGKCCSAEDHIALAKIVRDFAVKKDFSQYEKNSLAYYEATFTKDKTLRILESELQSLAQG